MAKQFLKTLHCGCVIVTITCGIKTNDKSITYLIGGHKHFNLCSKCEQEEKNGNDTLYDMWITDNVTDDYDYAGWKEIIQEK